MNSKSAKGAKAKSLGKKLTMNKQTLRDLPAGGKRAAGVRGGAAPTSKYCQGAGQEATGNT